MIIRFKDIEERDLIKNFVKLVADVYDNSGVCTIDSVACKIRKCTDTLQLERNADPDNDEVKCFHNILQILNHIGADEVNAASDILQRYKDNFTESDVPRFINMLNEHGVYPAWCTELFKHWCIGEGLGQMAIDCFEIQSARNNNMTDVYNWCCNNMPTQSTLYEDEVRRWIETVK